MVNYYKDAQLFYKIFFRLESQESKAYNKKKSMCCRQVQVGMAQSGEGKNGEPRQQYITNQGSWGFHGDRLED